MKLRFLAEVLSPFAHASVNSKAYGTAPRSVRDLVLKTEWRLNRARLAKLMNSRRVKLTRQIQPKLFFLLDSSARRSYSVSVSTYAVIRSIVAVASLSTANVSRFQLFAQRRITKHECFGAGDFACANASGRPC